jgi:hypothetical protein
MFKTINYTSTKSFGQPLMPINPIHELISKHGEWGQHPVYTTDQWKTAVNKDLTRKAYWVWVEDQNQIELDAAEDAMYA